MKAASRPRRVQAGGPPASLQRWAHRHRSLPSEMLPRRAVLWRSCPATCWSPLARGLASRRDVSEGSSSAEPFEALRRSPFSPRSGRGNVGCSPHLSWLTLCLHLVCRIPFLRQFTFGLGFSCLGAPSASKDEHDPNPPKWTRGNPVHQGEGTTKVSRVVLAVSQADCSPLQPCWGGSAPVGRKDTHPPSVWV